MSLCSVVFPQKNAVGHYVDLTLVGDCRDAPKQRYNSDIKIELCCDIWVNFALVGVQVVPLIWKCAGSLSLFYFTTQVCRQLLIAAFTNLALLDILVINTDQYTNRYNANISSYPLRKLRR